MASAGGRAFASAGGLALELGKSARRTVFGGSMEGLDCACVAGAEVGAGLGAACAGLGGASAGLAASGAGLSAGASGDDEKRRENQDIFPGLVLAGSLGASLTGSAASGLGSGLGRAATGPLIGGSSCGRALAGGSEKPLAAWSAGPTGSASFSLPRGSILGNWCRPMPGGSPEGGRAGGGVSVFGLITGLLASVPRDSEKGTIFIPGGADAGALAAGGGFGAGLTGPASLAPSGGMRRRALKSQWHAGQRVASSAT